MMFEILRERADEGWEIAGDGVLEVLQDGFGFLRSPEANYLPGPDDIYVSPDMIRQHSLRPATRSRVSSWRRAKTSAISR
jgi:transcription termination factor Rho